METNQKDYSEQIEKTVNSISDHLEKKSVTGLTTTINKWIDTLEAHKDLKSITSNLKKLLPAIEDKNVDKIINLMETLGEETTKASEMVKGIEATKIKALGKALTTGAKTIAKLK